jgi:signal transduction histidine kinase
MRPSLATKISLVLVGVLVLAVLSSIVSILSAFRFEAFQKTLVTDNLASVQAAEELEIALLEQRGYVLSYILDGGKGKWLEQLAERRKSFDYWLTQARETARSDPERKLLDRLEIVQHSYAGKRDEVVSLYDSGQEEAAKRVLLGDVVALYEQTYNLCEEIIDANQQLVDETSADVRRQVEQVTLVIIVVLIVTMLLGMALLWFFFQGVIFPLRRLAADARSAAGEKFDDVGHVRTDELRELGRYVEFLMVDVAETRSDLAHSRTQLARSEKLAAVGKLAASVAHEIRNPLTSMKMWLYSLRRTMGADHESQQKLDVLSDEIARLDNIVRHFLEFSRPPQLKTAPQQMGQILDKTVGLVRYRLEEQHIEVRRTDEPGLPEVPVDAEQLIQVFVNLINNAVEVMPHGGLLRLSIAKSSRGGQEVLAVHLADTGSGMPEDVQQRIFEPFFTTKPEGTGLGLCIAASVMARHGGGLMLESSSSEGTEWVVWIPTIAHNS